MAMANLLVVLVALIVAGCVSVYLITESPRASMNPQFEFEHQVEEGAPKGKLPKRAAPKAP